MNIPSARPGRVSSFAMDRRGFLRSALVAGAASLLPSSAPAEDPVPLFDANAFVRDFPEICEVPGIAEIERITCENAQKVFVLIRQWHEDWEMTWEQIRVTERCQTEILAALDALRRDPRMELHTVHNESTLEGQEIPYVADYRRFVRERLTPNTSGGTTFAEMLEDEELLQRRMHNMSTLARAGAVEILTLRGHLFLAGAENPDVRRRMDRERDPGRFQEIQYDEREDALLGIAAGAPHHVVYAVYGAAHDFRDNLERWNAKGCARFAGLILHPHAVDENDPLDPASPGILAKSGK